MSEDDFSIFDAEEKIIADAKSFSEGLDKQSISNVNLKYKELLRNYQKLFRESRRLIRMNDKIGDELAQAMSKLEAYSEQLSHEAATDSLTGLPNRRKISSELDAHLESYSKKGSKPFQIMILDIDHFKSVNDEYGHSAGDTVIKEIAQTAQHMNNTSYEGGMFGRFGGEEFLGIVKVDNKNTGYEVAEKIRKAIEDSEIKHEDYNLSVTVSIGMASAEETSEYSSLIDLADERLYRAKRGGRNMIVME